MAPYAVPRQAPPVRPSRSLEGLEQVVPPRVSKPPASCVPVSRPSLHLDKPLPDLPTAPKPLPSTPSMAGGSTAWSDDSSIVDSIDTRPPSDAVSDDFPVVVRSGSDDLEHGHAPVESPSLDQIIDSYAKQPPLTTITSPPSINNPYLTDDYAYSSPSAAWTPRAGPNHYFREKKWDFFPELAPGSPVSTTFPTNNNKPRKTSSSRLNLSSSFDRTKKNISTIKPWTSSPSDRSHAHSLAHDVRDSIRDLVHRRLSRHQSVVDRSKSHSKSTKRKPNPRPSTAPSECIFNINSLPRRKTPSSQYSERGCPLPYESALEVPLDRLSLSYSSSMEEESQSSTSNSNFSSSSRCSELPTRTKQKKQQLAVPMSPYQKYGAAIFDRAGREKRKSVRPNRQVRFPRYYQKNIHGLVGLNVDVDMDMDGDVDGDGDEEEEEPPLSPSSGLQQKTREGVKALQDGTSQVLVKLDGARRRVVSAKIERKRSQLKAKIRVVGPVNPTTVYGDPWV